MLSPDIKALAKTAATMALFALLTAPASPFPRPINPGTAYIFGDSVNVRKEPKVKSQALTKLAIGTEISVLKNAGVKGSYGGLTDSWYLVKAGGKEGYVLGLLIADHSFKGDLDGDGTEEQVLIKNLTEGGYSTIETGVSTLELRVVKKGKLAGSCFMNCESELYGGNLEEISIGTISMKAEQGFSRPLTLLHMAFIFNAEEGGTGECLFYYRRGKLSDVLTIIHERGEGGYMCENDVIFPADPHGIKDSIIIKEKCGDMSVAITPVYDRITTTIYRWDGAQERFVKIK